MGASRGSLSLTSASCAFAGPFVLPPAAAMKTESAAWKKGLSTTTVKSAPGSSSTGSSASSGGGGPRDICCRACRTKAFSAFDETRSVRKPRARSSAGFVDENLRSLLTDVWPSAPASSANLKLSAFFGRPTFATTSTTNSPMSSLRKRTSHL